MDVIMDCYFDDVFCQLERSYLMVRYKRRQLVDYLNTVIKGCMRGADCAEATAIACAVMAAVRYHANSKTLNGEVCLMGKFHNILYIAAKLCYDWKLKDNTIVAQLLNDIYHCEQTFERLFIGAILGTRVTNLISGWKSDFENPEENLAAIEYFLNHATEAKLEYDHNGRKTRLVDISMESYARTQPLRIAVQFGKAEVLLLLLRYGAAIMNDYETDELPMERSLIYFCRAHVSSSPLNQTEGPFSCLKVLIRAVPTMVTLPSDSFDGEVRVFIGRNSCGLNRLYFHPKLVQDGIVPPSRSGLIPPELKHLSRCAIRNALGKNWQLPLGIRSLRVPSSLQDYLDLLED
jgi:ankyrin repeat/SOCS box protein 17